MTTHSHSTSSSAVPCKDGGAVCRGAATVSHGIRVDVEPAYLEGHSNPFEGQYIFQYHVQLTNESDVVVTLRRRHWIIIDEQGEREEVTGDGVIGMQPTLQPGHSFEYESYCPLNTRWGTMEGSYTFEHEEDGTVFEVEIPRFFLVAPPAEED